jgi:hypothetical protein
VTRTKEKKSISSKKKIQDAQQKSKKKIQIDHQEIQTLPAHHDMNTHRKMRHYNNMRRLGKLRAGRAPGATGVWRTAPQTTANQLLHPGPGARSLPPPLLLLFSLNLPQLTSLLAKRIRIGI